MKTAVVCAAVALSGTFFSLLAIGNAQDKSCCLLCAASGKATTVESTESKGTAVNKMALTAEKPVTQKYSCLLSPQELKARSLATHTQIIAKAEEIVETQDGYKLKFVDADDALVTTLAEWINVERKCCSFFQFELTVEQFNGPLWLEVGGDAGAKQFLKNVLEK